MTTVTIPKELQFRLQELNVRAELRGEDGQLVGLFEPLATTTPADWRKNCPYSDDELNELSKQTGGRPLKDILADLEARWPSK